MCHWKLDAKLSDYSQRKDYLSHHATVFQGNRTEARGGGRNKTFVSSASLSTSLSTVRGVFFSTVCFGTQPLRQVSQIEFPQDARDGLKNPKFKFKWLNWDLFQQCKWAETGRLTAGPVSAGTCVITMVTHHTETEFSSCGEFPESSQSRKWPQHWALNAQTPIALKTVGEYRHPFRGKLSLCSHSHGLLS